MIAVLFEGWPAAGQGETYLDIAARLRPMLDGVPGFISVERFRSLSDPDKLLSLSFWEDEAAVTAWRNTAEHRVAQAAGRREVFRDYRLRVAAVIRDTDVLSGARRPPTAGQPRPIDFQLSAISPTLATTSRTSAALPSMLARITASRQPR